MLGFLLQGDTTVVANHPAWWGVGLLGLWQVVGPVISSWLYKQWGTVQAKLSGVPKMLLYVVISTVVLQLPRWIGYSMDPGPDNWTPAVFLDVLTSIGATVLYKFGTKPNKPVAASFNTTKAP